MSSSITLYELWRRGTDEEDVFYAYNINGRWYWPSSLDTIQPIYPDVMGEEVITIPIQNLDSNPVVLFTNRGPIIMTNAIQSIGQNFNNAIIHEIIGPLEIPNFSLIHPGQIYQHLPALSLEPFSQQLLNKLNYIKINNLTLGTLNSPTSLPYVPNQSIYIPAPLPTNTTITTPFNTYNPLTFTPLNIMGAPGAPGLNPNYYNNYNYNYSPTYSPLGSPTYAPSSPPYYGNMNASYNSP